MVPPRKQKHELQDSESVLKGRRASFHCRTLEIGPSSEGHQSGTFRDNRPSASEGVQVAVTSMSWPFGFLGDGGWG